jgi:hypothetical protein
MPRLLRLFAGAAIAASLSLALPPGAALSASKGKLKAFNPQPDPPGKVVTKGSKSLGGPDTKGSWKRFHEVDEKSKSKSGFKSLPAVQKSKKP